MRLHPSSLRLHPCFRACKISWKQRFFIPTDETTGIDILAALLDRYPAIAADAAIEDEVVARQIAREIRATNIIDLDQWIVPVESANAAFKPVDESTSESDTPTPEAARRRTAFLLAQEFAVSWPQFSRITQSQLAFDFG